MLASASSPLTGQGVTPSSPHRPESLRRFLLSAAILAALGALNAGCNEELGPLNEDSGFSGVIRFKNWPPADSVREMRLIVFESVPTDSSSIIPTLLARRAAAWPALERDFPRPVDSLPYVFTTKTGTNLQVTNYDYVAVVYQFGSNVLTDWRPAGVYSVTPGRFEPAPLRVLLHRTTENVDIQVDFHNLPPVPWR